MDTFAGGEYREAFQEVVEFLAHAVRTRTAESQDAPVLDFIWERVRKWNGFGGKWN